VSLCTPVPLSEGGVIGAIAPIVPSQKTARLCAAILNHPDTTPATPFSTAVNNGLKCLRKIRPLFSRLRKVDTKRDRVGSRQLFMDQYCAPILMSLFSRMDQSLRDLQRACALNKARQRTHGSRSCPRYEQ
jgi:hypothetical protein